MDFSIFSKPLSVPGLGKSRMAKARERAAARKPSPTLELVQKHGEVARFTKTRQGTAAERAKAAAIAGGVAEVVPAFELTDNENGLSPALENAALLHASGQSDVARTLLGGAISNDIDTRELPRAWHAQFDLLQRADDAQGFEQLALEYVTQFELSPPPWDDRRKAVPKSQRTMAGYFAITQINVKTALEIPARAGRFASLKIDVSTVSMFDEIGCRRMVDVLRRLRRQEYPVTFQGLEHLAKQVAAKTTAGVPENEGVWLLDLEILQWKGDMHAFDDRAFEFAITFEMSPPAWEPPTHAQSSSPADGAPAAPGVDSQSATAMPEAFSMQGVLTGPTDPQVAALVAFAADRTWIPIDISQVDRIDFVCAGSLQNMLSGLIASKKEVQLIGASPVVEALLLLIGLDPELFDKRRRT